MGVVVEGRRANRPAPAPGETDAIEATATGEPLGEGFVEDVFFASAVGTRAQSVGKGAEDTTAAAAALEDSDSEELEGEREEGVGEDRDRDRDRADVGVDVVTESERERFAPV